MNDIRIKCAHCKAIQPIKKSDIKTDKKAQARLMEIDKLVKNVPEFVPKKFVPYKKTWKDKINPFFFVPYSESKDGMILISR